VEPFWGLYQQHMKQEVRDILEQYRIGSLKGGAAAVAPTEDPYRNEPRRHPALIVRSDKPFNGETPAQLLAASAVTPNDMFFVRHHLPVPVIDNEKFSVAVGEPLSGCVQPVQHVKLLRDRHTHTHTLYV
jgi:sulfite oxidase